MRLKWVCDTLLQEWRGFDRNGVCVAVADQYAWGWKAQRKTDDASKTFRYLREAKAWCEEEVK